MKSFILSLILFVLSVKEAKAQQQQQIQPTQINQISSTNCICYSDFYFSYDENGNRIQRSYIRVCTVPNCGTISPNTRLLADSIFEADISDTTLNYMLNKEQIANQNNDESNNIKSVYPNPTKGNFIVSLSNYSDNAYILLFDLNGNKIIETNMSGSELHINIEELSIGTYILLVKLPNSKENKSYKIMKI
jgi:hypothetical protein